MKKILVIEDNRDIRENTIEILELYGYEVISAFNGTVGIQKAKQEKPDLILCDIMMPETDGYQVLKALLADPKTKNIPLIYLTASVEKKEVQFALDMGARGYIRKPFEVEELTRTIEENLKA